MSWLIGDSGYTERPLSGSISLRVTYILSTPSFFQERVRAGETLPAFIGGTPELRKLDKLVLRSLEHVVIGGKGQVATLQSRKVYKNTLPKTIITISGTQFRIPDSQSPSPSSDTTSSTTPPPEKEDQE